MLSPGPFLLAGLLLASAAAESPSGQDAIVDKFERYVKKSVHELEDLKGMISDHRKAMEHGEEIVGGDFQPLPPLGLQTTSEAPTTTTTEAPSTTSASWGGFLGTWSETTTQAPWTTPAPQWTTPCHHEDAQWSGQQSWTTKPPWNSWSQPIFPPTPKPWLSQPPALKPWEDEWGHPAPQRRQFHRLKTRQDMMHW